MTLTQDPSIGIPLYNTSKDGSNYISISLQYLGRNMVHYEALCWHVRWWIYPHAFDGYISIFLQIDKGKIWTFEQEQALGFSSVTTNIRMTVVKLKSGGLWVHAPIAPTKECIQVHLKISQ